MQIFGARLQIAFLWGPGETIRDKQMPRQAAGNHPPSAIQAQRRPDPSLRLGISAAGSDARKTPQFAGDHTARDHPFPSRTRKLSLAGPMVLHGRLCGRLGDRRQYSSKKAMPPGRGLFCVCVTLSPSLDETLLFSLPALIQACKTPTLSSAAPLPVAI